MTNRRSTTFSNRRMSQMSRNYNSVGFVSNVKLGPVTHTVLVALMITVLGLIYLTQATKATSYDYAASKIDNQIAELMIQKNDLAVENARLMALDNIASSSVAASMTKPQTTDYVEQ